MSELLSILGIIVCFAIIMTSLGLLINSIINGGRKWWE